MKTIGCSLALLAVAVAIGMADPPETKRPSLSTFKSLLTKQAMLQTQLQTEVEKLTALQNEIAGISERAAGLPRAIHQHVDDIPRHIPEAQREAWGARWFEHIHAVWGWQPPGGWRNTLAGHMNAVEGGRPRRENVAAANQAISDNIHGAKDKSNQLFQALVQTRDKAASLTPIKNEIRRLQGELAWVNTEIIRILEVELRRQIEP
jgi:hypothetical protein